MACRDRHKTGVCLDAERLKPIIRGFPMTNEREAVSETQRNFSPVSWNPQIDSTFAIRRYGSLNIQHLKRNVTSVMIDRQRQIAGREQKFPTLQSLSIIQDEHGRGYWFGSCGA